MSLQEKKRRSELLARGPQVGSGTDHNMSAPRHREKASCLLCAGVMWDHRLRRCPNIEQASGR